MTPPEPNVIAQMVYGAISGATDNTARSQQKGAGILGPSDIGFCRNKAALVSKQVEPTDGRSALWSAAIGTALHLHVGGILEATFPDWIVEGQRVTAVLPNGAEITGTPDLIVPEWNAVLDLKSANGLSVVRREGASQNHRYQRFLYADGACRAGLLDRDQPVYVGNIYLDRSGVTREPHVDIEEVDWSLADQVSSWVDDVIYAVQHDEDAPRDVTAAVCEKICEFYTVCRGGLPADDTELIVDNDVLTAVDTYVEGRDMKRTGDRMMTDAKAVLSGINGSTGTWQVRTTHVPASERAASQTSSYDKVEVVKVRSPR